MACDLATGCHSRHLWRGEIWSKIRAWSYWKTLLILSLVSVVISLLAATFTLGGMPTVIERLPSKEPDENGLYDMSVYGHLRVWQVVFVEHLFFVLGILFFSAFLCISIAGHK